MKKQFSITDFYTVEELLPIVGDLVKKYTSNESTSVTYERARILMDSVIYCIRHFYEKNTCNVPISETIPAKEAYSLGLKIVREKTASSLEKYNHLLEYFCDYGNIAYRDTVTKGLFYFFQYYDAQFESTEHLITMDYPVLKLDVSLEGIDRVEQYITLICEEQDYLQRYPKDFVINELRLFHPEYEYEIFNLREVLERAEDNL